MIRYGTLEDIERILEIQELEINHQKQTYLSPIDRESFEISLSRQHLVVFEEDEKILGFRMVWIPEEDDYLGDFLNDKRHVIYYDITVIDPNERGKGLQHHMGKWLRENIIHSGKYDWVLSTVHPDNIPSMKDKFRLGMHIGYLGEMYGGKERFIFIDELTEPEWLMEEITVERKNRSKMQQLLKQGYKGKALNDDLNIIFDRL